MERTKHLTMQIVLTIGILFLYYVELSRSQPAIIESLKRLSPLFLQIAFLTFVTLLIVYGRDLIRPFLIIPAKKWILVGLILIMAFGLSFFAAPRTHRIYYDENIYLHIGQSIALTGKAQMINFGEFKYGELFVNQGEYNKQPNAYPYLLSVFYRLFGVSENLSFLINNIVFSLSCLIVFAIAFLLFQNFKTGLYAALVFAVIPQSILWSNSTSAEPANTFFLSLTVLLMILALRSEKIGLYLLAAVSACLAAQCRMESLLIFPLLAVFLVLRNRKILKEQKLYYIVPLVLFLLTAHALHFVSFQNHPWGAAQEKYSLSFFGHNLGTNGMFFLNNKDFPMILSLALALAFFSRKFWKEKIQIVTWFVFFWGIFLFFYAGSYYYGADIRFSLMAFPAFSILAAIGLTNADDWIFHRFKKPGFYSLIVVCVAFLAFAPKMRTEGQEAWAARYDHYYAKEMLKSLPPNSIVFTHNPNMFLFWGASAAQASIIAGYDQNGINGLKSNFPGGIYFHFNFWCNVSDPLQQSFCKSILDKFPHSEVVKFQERDYKYILYKIE